VRSRDGPWGATILNLNGPGSHGSSGLVNRRGRPGGANSADAGFAHGSRHPAPPRIAQISILEPSSTTALFGSLRKSAAALALWCIWANSFSRQVAMPPPMVGTTTSRDRK